MVCLTHRNRSLPLVVSSYRGKLRLPASVQPHRTLAYIKANSLNAW